MILGGAVFSEGGENGRKEASLSELANDVMRPERPESLARKRPLTIIFILTIVDIEYRTIERPWWNI